ncbi:MAG: DUF4783 domain-containing protein [Salinibacter sp.]
MVVPVARGQKSALRDAQAAPDTIITRVTTAFSEGDAQRLLTPAADRVEVSLFGTRTFYSSAQAYYVLDDFFDRHPPTDFVVDDVTEAGDSCFLRGRFEHRRDERTLQVYVRLTRRDAAWRLQEIRIDADTE